MTYSYATLATTASTTLADIAFVAPDYETNFTPQAVPVSANTDVTMAGMFVPVGRTFQLELLTAGPVNGQPITKLLNIDLGEEKTLEKGKKHKITLTFRESPGITDPINITSSVAPWEPGNNAEHELE